MKDYYIKGNRLLLVSAIIYIPFVSPSSFHYLSRRCQLTNNILCFEKYKYQAQATTFPATVYILFLNIFLIVCSFVFNPISTSRYLTLKISDYIVIIIFIHCIRLRRYRRLTAACAHILQFILWRLLHVQYCQVGLFQGLKLAKISLFTIFTTIRSRFTIDENRIMNFFGYYNRRIFNFFFQVPRT